MSEEIKIIEQGGEIIYQQDRAVIDIQIATAKAYPRDIVKSIKNAVDIVTIDKETAATCSYAVPRGGKVITGVTVHMAKVLAQTWGNMRIEAKVINIEQKHITSQAIAFDLENNVAIKVEVKRSIMTRTGRMNDDMITVTGNAANSIALRNAILAVIPRAITDKVYNAAKDKITGDLVDEAKFLKRRKQIFDGFENNYKKKESDVLSLIGKTSIEQITKDDLVVLIGIAQAIKDGDTTIDEAFEKAKEPKEKKTGQEKKEDLKAKIKEEKQEQPKENKLPEGCRYAEPNEVIEGNFTTYIDTASNKRITNAPLKVKTTTELTEKDKKEIAAKEKEQAEKQSNTKDKITHNPTLDMQ